LDVNVGSLLLSVIYKLQPEAATISTTLKAI